MHIQITTHSTHLIKPIFLFNIVYIFLTIFPSTVPPNIDDSLSSSDVIVREGSNVTLRCRATGSPLPTVKWKRDDNAKININKSLVGKENIKTNEKFNGGFLSDENCFYSYRMGW